MCNSVPLQWNIITIIIIIFHTPKIIFYQTVNISRSSAILLYTFIKMEQFVRVQYKFPKNNKLLALTSRSVLASLGEMHIIQLRNIFNYG